MAIVASANSGKDFAPAPAGTHSAVCCDVVDMGILKVNFGGKEKSQHKVKIVWQIDEDRDDGKRFCVRKRYTLSLHEKANLRKDLESWRGKPFTPAELEGFDLEVLMGISCLLSVVHAMKDGSTWANVAAIMKLPKTMQAIQIKDYVRECDRKEGAESMPDTNGPDITDDDIPF